jgi:hypothetical protein
MYTERMGGENDMELQTYRRKIKCKTKKNLGKVILRPVQALQRQPGHLSTVIRLRARRPWFDFQEGQ